MNKFSKFVLKYSLLMFVIAIAIGGFLGMHANQATYNYLEQHYYFNDTAHGIIALIVNIGVLFLPCYIWARYLVAPARKKIEEEFNQKSN